MGRNEKYATESVPQGGGGGGGGGGDEMITARGRSIATRV